jgi:hypothetical protein
VWVKLNGRFYCCSGKGLVFYIRNRTLTFFIYFKQASLFPAPDVSTVKQPWDRLAPSHTASAVLGTRDEGRPRFSIDISSLPSERQKLELNKETGPHQGFQTPAPGTQHSAWTAKNLRPAFSEFTDWPQTAWPTGLALPHVLNWAWSCSLSGAFERTLQSGYITTSVSLGCFALSGKRLSFLGR